MNVVHLIEEMVPVQKEQVSVAVVSALEDSSDLLEVFRGDECRYFCKIGHFWLVVLLLEVIPLVEVQSLCELQLRQYPCKILKFLIIKHPSNQILSDCHPFLSAFEDLLNISDMFILSEICKIEEDVDYGFQFFDREADDFLKFR